MPVSAEAPEEVDVCVPKRTARRFLFAATLLLCLTWGISVLAQSRPPVDRASVEDRWIVLVDVSASLDQLDRQVSTDLGNPRYRLRSELLSLLQVFLGAMDDIDARRNGFLKVEFFGHGVEAASGLPAWPLHWEDAKNEDWWTESVPHALSGRTELMPALNQAAEDFAAMNPQARKHLLILSDGELDVGPVDRNSGVPFGDEERKAYSEMMSPSNHAAEKLRALNVKVDAIVLDPLAAGDGQDREATIRKKLTSTGEASVQRQFEKLLDELGSAIASTGRQPYSEGPYFLHALTETLGGQSRPVHPANLGDVVWHTVFPDASKTGNIAPGSRSLVVLAKAAEPVRLCFDGSGEQRDLVLRYDKERNDYVREPKDSTADVRVRYHATSRYVTWLINAPGVTCVDPPAAYYGWETAEPRTTVVDPAPWWSLAAAPRLAVALGTLLCFSLVFVYREQLKDLSITPKAPFDFAIQNAGNTTFTKLGQRKAVRFSIDEKGIRVDLGRRVGRGATAVFAPTDRTSLSYRLYGKGNGWEYRQNRGDKVSGEYIPLGERGVEISFLDFVQRSTVDLKHGDRVVRIRHSSYTSASEG